MACGSWGIGPPPHFANRLDESVRREIGESFVSSPMTHSLGMNPLGRGQVMPVSGGKPWAKRRFGSPPAPR